MDDVKAGVSLFFAFSGRGTQREDTNGDEFDGWDQAICALGGHILVDDLYELLVENVPKDARLTSLIDACRSGTSLI